MGNIQLSFNYQLDPEATDSVLDIFLL